MPAAPIHVEITIRAPLEELWERTQNPAARRRWDLRLSKIDDLPRESAETPQRFTYETMISLGMRATGTGESVRSHDTPHERSCALTFASNDPTAIVHSSSEYWKYIRSDKPADQHNVRFIVLYTYEPRFGTFGTLLDRIILRPMLRWATAWSLDRLRLWLERGIDPELSALRASVHAVCRSALAFIWIWHGLVPKILAQHPTEIAFLKEPGLFVGSEVQVTLAAGVGEVMFGVAHLLFWRVRWLYLFDLVIFAMLGVAATLTIPSLALGPFNPVSFSVILAAVCLAGWLACRDLPGAHRCIRIQPQRAP